MFETYDEARSATTACGRCAYRFHTFLPSLELASACPNCGAAAEHSEEAHHVAAFVRTLRAIARGIREREGGSVAPHHRCGIGRKHEHGPHRFRGYIMGGIVKLYCPGYREGGAS